MQNYKKEMITGENNEQTRNQAHYHKNASF